MIKVILIHGNGGGRASDNWLPYIKAQLGQAGIQVIAQDFPDNDLARCSAWIPITEARHIHDMLKTEYYEFTDRGHFGGDRDVREFKECVSVLKGKLHLR